MGIRVLGVGAVKMSLGPTHNCAPLDEIHFLPCRTSDLLRATMTVMATVVVVHGDEAFPLLVEEHDVDASLTLCVDVHGDGGGGAAFFMVPRRFL